MKRLLLAAFLLAAPLGATTYFASTTGTGTACTIGSPCSLVTAAAAQSAGFNIQAGDTVLIEDGTYTLTGNGLQFLANTGTAANPINYKPQHPFKVYIDWKGAFSSAGHTQGIWPGRDQTNCPKTPPWTDNHQGWYIQLWDIFFLNTSTQARKTSTGLAPPEQNEFILGGFGSKVIHCIFYDTIDGLETSAQDCPGGGGTAAYEAGGNFYGYPGFINVNTRGSGHAEYLRNGYFYGTAGAALFNGNVGLGAMDVADQHYSTQSGTSAAYMTEQYAVMGGNGVCSGAAACAAWVAYPSHWDGCCADVYYLGPDGATSSDCFTSSQKVWYTDTFQNNWAISASNGWVIGGSKGACNDQILSNRIFGTGGQVTACCQVGAACGPGTPPPTCPPGPGCGWFAPQTFTGNTLYAPLNGNTTGCGTAAPLTLANYPSNTVNAGMPSSGTIGPEYWASPYETGRGYARIANFDSVKPATITISLDSMGAYQGEAYRIQSWMGVDPNDPTYDLVTGICTTNPCGTINIDPTAVKIRPPGFTLDGSTPWPTPPDMWNTVAPRYAVLFIAPRNDVSTTPTPTNTVTNTPTNTPTQTPTFTRTPTLTPSPTSAASNTPTVTPTSTFTAAPTLTPSQTPTASPTPTFNGLQFSVKSGPCVMGGNGGSITADSTAPGGFAWSSSITDQGTLTCSVFLQPGIYRVWESVLVPSATMDSTFFSFNGDQGYAATATPTGSNTPTRTATNTPITLTPTPSLTPTPGNSPTRTPNVAGMGDGDTTNPDIYDMAESQQPCSGANPCQYSANWRSEWQWQIHNDRSWSCGSCLGVGTERDLVVTTAGTYTLAWRGREAGAEISYVVLTTCLSCGAPVLPSSTGFCSYSFTCKKGQRKISQPCGIPVKNPCPGD